MNRRHRDVNAVPWILWAERPPDTWHWITYCNEVDLELQYLAAAALLPRDLQSWSFVDWWRLFLFGSVMLLLYASFRDSSASIRPGPWPVQEHTAMEGLAFNLIGRYPIMIRSSKKLIWMA